mmetsp:Transcript_150486/g.262966  ORF Transcript_150486/g.262966 Transcript_150486/m.262966 type:complete len:255 (-) Transcript_150486:135-899(-)
MTDHPHNTPYEGQVSVKVFGTLTSSARDLQTWIDALTTRGLNAAPTHQVGLVRKPLPTHWRRLNTTALPRPHLAPSPFQSWIAHTASRRCTSLAHGPVSIVSTTAPPPGTPSDRKPSTHSAHQFWLKSVSIAISQHLPWPRIAHQPSTVFNSTGRPPTYTAHCGRSTRHPTEEQLRSPGVHLPQTPRRPLSNYSIGQTRSGRRRQGTSLGKAYPSHPPAVGTEGDRRGHKLLNRPTASDPSPSTSGEGVGLPQR